jgi:hypothetical protein
MTAAELIEVLKQFPPDLEVVRGDSDGRAHGVQKVESRLMQPRDVPLGSAAHDCQRTVLVIGPNWIYVSV